MHKLKNDSIVDDLPIRPIISNINTAHTNLQNIYPSFCYLLVRLNTLLKVPAISLLI